MRIVNINDPSSTIAGHATPVRVALEELCNPLLRFPTPRPMFVRAAFRGKMQLGRADAGKERNENADFKA